MKRLWAELTRAWGWLFPPDGDSDGEVVLADNEQPFGYYNEEWDGMWDSAANDIDGDAEEVWTDWLGFESDDD